MTRQTADPRQYTLSEAGLSLLLAVVLAALPASVAFMNVVA